jgi:hypothetical protein
MASKKTTKPKKTKVSVAPPKVVEAAPTVKTPRKWLKRPKRAPIENKIIPSGFKLLKGAIQLARKNWKVFGTIVIIAALLNIIFVQQLSSLNVSDLRQRATELAGGNGSEFNTGLALLGLMIGGGTSTPNSDVAPSRSFIFIGVWLALIWTIRQVLLNKKVRARDGFYKGMYPLVPFLGVLMVVGLQLLPLLAGATLYSTVLNNGTAINAREQILWLGVFIVPAALSVYMFCSSFFALYIVTLPDMTPLKALRSARPLVKYRRLVVLRKMLFLPLVMFVAIVVVMLPVILFMASASGVVFFIITMMALALAHIYYYLLYRELL